MSLLRIGIFYQYVVDEFVNQVMNAFVFPDRELPIISILYGWSGTYCHSEFCVELNRIFSCNNNKTDHFYLIISIL